jgi:hypothetical protein
MDIISLCHKLFGFNNFQIDHNQCNLRIHSTMTGREFIDMAASEEFERRERRDGFDNETMTFTFYLTDEPIFIVTINENAFNEADNEGFLNEAFINERFIWIDLTELSTKHKNRNLWKMLYIVLAQKYKPIVYNDELDELDAFE